MGTKSILIGLIVLYFFSSNVLATNVNGRFVIVNSDSLKLSLLLQINTNTGTDAMGGATIVIEFDTSSTTFKSNPIINTDYIIHNFCGGNYSPATITRPMSNKIWVNIDLPYNNNNSGTVVASGDNWTDVATIYFDIVNNQGLASFWWKTNSNFWGIYSDNNLTLWDIGQFEDQVNYSIPVELFTFTASIFNNEAVQLKWISATSLNNHGFEVERASLSASPLLVWEGIGFVEGTGTSTSPIEYSFMDNTIFRSNVVKYRLKIIDLDGSFSYSNIIEIETGLNNFDLSQNYPNPFNPSTKIRYTVASPNPSQRGALGKVLLKVYDILGNEIATLVDEEKSAGRYEVDFNAANLPDGRQGLASGIYIYKLTTTNYTETKKMLLLR